MTLDELEDSLALQLVEADQWYNGVQSDEITWIAAGRNADEEFSRKYYTDPEVVSESSGSLMKSRWWTWTAATIGAVVVLTVVTWLLRRTLRQRTVTGAQDTRQ